MQKDIDPGDVRPAAHNPGIQKTKHEAITIALMFCMGSFVSDRLFKYFIMHDLYPTEVLRPGILAIVKHQNFGLLGDFPTPLYFNLFINFVALAVLIYAAYLAFKRARPLESIALGFLLGGALGNLYDRLVYGYVFDWLMLFNTSIINAADAYIATGMVLYVLLHYLENKNRDVNQ